MASFSQLLERRYEGQLDERADQYIAFAVDGAKRMQVLINDLLAFSRVGRLHPRARRGRTPTSWSTRRWPTCRWRSRRPAPRSPSPTSCPRCPGTSPLLAGVFQNLIGNALKFRGPSSRRAIHVGVGRRRRRVGVLASRDNGIGIEPEYADRIFVIFQRLHPKDAYPGTGIGLAMCRKIVEYHGGRIWLDTDGGRPAPSFRFTLPKLATRPARRLPRPPKSSETAG